MEITREKINAVKELQAQVDVLLEDAGVKVALAKANSGNKMKWTKAGKEIECEEEHLWNETWHLGEKCDAYKALAEKYPEAFEAVKKQNEKIKELSDYVQANIGVSFNKMRFTDILQITEAVFDLKMAENAEIRITKA
jgi:hypothetical protein